MVKFYNNVVWCNIYDLVEEIADTPEKRSLAHSALEYYLSYYKYFAKVGLQYEIEHDYACNSYRTIYRKIVELIDKGEIPATFMAL